MCSFNIQSILHSKPDATAYVNGSEEYPEIRGRVKFYQTDIGVLTVAEILGLPAEDGTCNGKIFAFHIHSGEQCTGENFADTLGHYNPNDCPHPYHSGDLPPLFSASGRALSTVLTDRFSVREIIGKTVIIHSMPDDFTTQPSGNSGTKIACGKIIK